MMSVYISNSFQYSGEYSCLLLKRPRFDSPVGRQHPFGVSLLAQLVKNPSAVWRPRLIPELGRSPGEGNNYPLQYSVLENSMDCTIHGVTKSHVYLCVSVHSVNVSTPLQINVLFQSSCPSWYGSAGKESASNAGDWVQSPGWEDPLRRERLPTPIF